MHKFNMAADWFAFFLSSFIYIQLVNLVPFLKIGDFRKIGQRNAWAMEQFIQFLIIQPKFSCDGAKKWTKERKKHIYIF